MYTLLLLSNTVIIGTSMNVYAWLFGRYHVMAFMH